MFTRPYAMNLHYTSMAHQTTSYKHLCQLHHNKLYSYLPMKKELYLSVIVTFGTFLIQPIE